MRERPLAGKRILVTRAHEQAPAFSREIIARGAIPVEVPLLGVQQPGEQAGLQQALQRLQAFRWILFTSANGVRFFFQALREQQRTFPEDVKVAVVGSKTFEALKGYHIHADVVPDEFVAEKLLETLKPKVNAGDKILMPRGALARKMLAKELTALGAEVSDVVVYETVMNEQSQQTLKDVLSKRNVHAITFTSSSTVQFFIALLEGVDWHLLIENVKIACIGPITAETSKKCGIKPDIIAEEYSTSGLLEALEQFFKEG